MWRIGSVFEPNERKIFAAGMYAATSCGRIGTNGASGSATDEKGLFLGGFGQAERAAEPPRGTGIGGGNPSEPPCEPHPSGGGAACGAPLASARFQPSGARRAVLAARALATPPLAGGQTAYKSASMMMSRTLHFKARAIRTSVSTVGFCSPRSIRPTKFRWQSTFSANSSWDSPKARRRTRTAAPSNRRSFGICLFTLARTTKGCIFIYTLSMSIPKWGRP